MINAVVFGCGWSGKYILQELSDSPQARIAAIIEPDNEKRCFYSKKYSCRHFISLEEVLGGGVEFDIAFVCTPPPIHFFICETLIKLGKNIFCEKPVCRETEKVLKLKKLVKQYKCKFGVNFNQRFAAAVQVAKTQLANDTNVHLFTASMNQKGPKKISGHIGKNFIITDSCCHILDLIYYLNGKITKVSTLINEINSEIIANITVNLVFKNGSIGNMSHSFVGGALNSQHPFQKLEIYTEKAKYVISNMYDYLTIYDHNSLMHRTFSPSVFEPRDYGHSIRVSVNSYINSVFNNLPLTVDIDDAVYNSILIRTIIRSIETGRLEKV